MFEIMEKFYSSKALLKMAGEVGGMHPPHPPGSTPVSNLRYTCCITPKRVTSGWAHLRGLRLGNPAPKKDRSAGETLATLCSISPTRDSNRRPPAPIAMS